ncbi:hypothetical protein EDD85DRAFT_797530 [Armillaria nabsnona]|nr:hypothetical protein EDD85DRAFT_797530 [Armillaria nabsnona]
MTLKLNDTRNRLIINQAQCRLDADFELPCGALEMQALFNVQRCNFKTPLLLPSHAPVLDDGEKEGSSGPRSSLANHPDCLYHCYWHLPVIYELIPSSAFLDTSEGRSHVWRVRASTTVHSIRLRLARPSIGGLASEELWEEELHYLPPFVALSRCGHVKRYLWMDPSLLQAGYSHSDAYPYTSLEVGMSATGLDETARVVFEYTTLDRFSKPPPRSLLRLRLHSPFIRDR